MSNKRLADLIEPVVAAAGMDLESVRVSVAGRRRLLRVVVDSDHGVSLDDAADVSREVSAALDAANAFGEVPYTLEVSSPGVDRPLTTPSHWRRAAGRLVRVKVTGEGSVEGRVVVADTDGVTMDVAGNERRFGYGALGAGAIQVEFGRVPDTDLEEFSEVPGGDRLPAWGAPAPHPPGPPYPPAAGPMKSKNIGPANPELDDAVFDNDTDLEHDDTVLDSDTDLGAGGDGH